MVLLFVRQANFYHIISHHISLTVFNIKFLKCYQSITYMWKSMQIIIVQIN